MLYRPKNVMPHLNDDEYEDYFKTFSEKIAYPLGVNIVFYLMTH